MLWRWLNTSSCSQLPSFLQQAGHDKEDGHRACWDSDWFGFDSSFCSSRSPSNRTFTEKRKKQPTKWEGNVTLHNTLNWSMGWIWIDTYHHYESPTTKVSIHATPLLTTMDSSIADDSHQMHKCHTWIGNSSDIHRIGRNDQYNFAMFPRHARWVWE